MNELPFGGLFLLKTRSSATAAGYIKPYKEKKMIDTTSGVVRPSLFISHERSVPPYRNDPAKNETHWKELKHACSTGRCKKSKVVTM